MNSGFVVQRLQLGFERLAAHGPMGCDGLERLSREQTFRKPRFGLGPPENESQTAHVLSNGSQFPEEHGDLGPGDRTQTGVEGHERDEGPSVVDRGQGQRGIGFRYRILRTGSCDPLYQGHKSCSVARVARLEAAIAHSEKVGLSQC